MSGIMAVASREVEERKAWLVASLAFGLVQLGLPFVAADVPARDLIAAGLSLAVPLAMALALGSTIIATDIGERRLGFYFSRPLSGLAIWGGKILGAIVLTAAATALVAGPVVWDTGDLPGGIHTAVFVAPLFFVFLAHVIASAVRSRSGLLPVDFVLLAVVAAVAVLTIQSLLKAGAQATLFLVGPWAAGGVIAILLLAGLAQVVSGRPDTRRGHRALSIALWGGLSVGVLAFAGFARWVLAVTPADLYVEPWGLELPARGNVFVLSGLGSGRAGFAPSFWIDASTGRFAREVPTSWKVFSDDGRYAVWIEDEPLRLVRARLDVMPPSLERVAIGGEAGWLIALSSDGGRAVARDGRRKRVIEVETGRVVGELPSDDWQTAEFMGKDRVRLIGPRSQGVAGGPGLRIIDWTPQTGAVIERASLGGSPTAVAEDGDRVLLLDRQVESLQLLDLESGRGVELSSVVRGARHAIFLASGSVAVFGCEDARAFVVEVAPDLVSGARIEIPGLANHRGCLVGSWMVESTPGLVSLSSRVTFEWQGVHVVDLRAGRELRYESDLSPAGQTRPAFEGPLHPAPDDSIATRLFIDGTGSLVDYDVRTGQRRIVLPPNPRRPPWGPVS